MSHPPASAVFWAQDQDSSLVLRNYAWTLWEQSIPQIRMAFPVVRPLSIFLIGVPISISICANGGLFQTTAYPIFIASTYLSISTSSMKCHISCQSRCEFSVRAQYSTWVFLIVIGPFTPGGDPNDGYWCLARSLHPQYCETNLDFINYHFRQDKLHGEHKYAWDEETLARSLRRSGFKRVERRAFDPSLDAESRKIGTLYMRTFKP
jgi:hypothetical protein